MKPYLNIAIRAAHRAGDHAMRAQNRLDRIRIDEKGKNDFVTNVDRECEQLIMETIHDAYRGHSFLGEESGQIDGQGNDADYVWIIDPIDGTTNFIHGNPYFAVSIALMVNGHLELGVVHDPSRQETFTAIRGEGASMDNRKIRVSAVRSLNRGLIGTGIPFTNLDETLNDYLLMLRDVVKLSAGIRRAGAAALDLAWVAAGRLDGFWELGLKPWDIAAGSLLVREAGGIVTDISGGERYMSSGNIIAAPPKLRAELGAVLKRHVAPETSAQTNEAAAST